MMLFHCYELGDELGDELAFPACTHDRYEIESDVSVGIAFSFGTAGCATDLSGILNGATEAWRDIGADQVSWLAVAEGSRVT